MQPFPLLSVSLFLFSLLTMKTVLLMLFIFNLKLLNRVTHSRFACTYNSKRIYMKIAFSCYEFQGKSRIIDDRAVYRKDIIVKLTQTNDVNFYYIYYSLATHQTCPALFPTSSILHRLLPHTKHRTTTNKNNYLLSSICANDSNL